MFPSRHLWGRLELRHSLGLSSRHFCSTASHSGDLDSTSNPVDLGIIQSTTSNKKEQLKKSMFRLSNKKTAASLVKHMNIAEDDVIIECNPGRGCITWELLNNPRVKSMRLLEPTLMFHPMLKRMRTQECRENVDLQIFCLNPTKLSVASFIDPEMLEELFKGVQKRTWSEATVVKVVGSFYPTESQDFLRRLILQVIEQKVLFKYGRPEFYLLISGKEWETMSATCKSNWVDYRGAGIIYDLMFETKLLERIKWDGNYPIIPKKQFKSPKYDQDRAYFVHLVPRKDLFDRFDSHGLNDLRFFINQLTMKRRQYLIPSMEKWFPLCGVELIRRGYSLYTMVGQLSTQEIVDLFLYVRSLPFYQDSNFCIAADQFISSIEEKVERRISYIMDEQETKGISRFLE